MRRLWTDVQQSQTVTYEQAKELFNLRCRSRNLSSLTLGWYKVVLGGFMRYLEAVGGPAPRETTPNHFRAYMDDMRQRGISSQTIDRTYGGLRCFFRYMAQERIIPQNPVTLVEKPKKSQVLIRPLDMDQVRLLLAQPKTKTYVGLRNWVMTLLMLDTGLRLSEALGLIRGNIDWAASRLIVRGKGDKERSVPFGTGVKKALWDYAQRRGDVAGQDIFFLDQFGGKICARHIQITLRRYGAKAGIQGVRVSPHTLRHTFATQYILNGGDAFSLQQILGHSTLEMVKVYVRLANRDVALQHRKYSPIDLMGAVPGKATRTLFR